MAEVLKKFGRYFLLDHIAQGGMAEIYRARLASVDGAGRLLVIKRIQAGYGANTEFLQMFRSEIKVTMGFNHPNVVQLYDFGEEQGQPYIAMEFVDGKNLRQFMTRFGELKKAFPVELAAHIIEQAAGALHYAHSFKDKISGQPLNVVHRDISPQNILISFDGTVKVIDFGIAKASTNSESTRAGVIKGKPSYLSPEQISGEQLDGRCDLFALGIVLWEMLCGKKLFAGDNDLAVLKLIESCQTSVKPPSTLNPSVPKELDYIVLRMLAKQREKRYQTGEELQRALHKFVYAFNPDFEPGALSTTAKDLFKDLIVEDRKRIQRLNEKVEQLMMNDIPEAPKAAAQISGKPKDEETDTIVDPRNSRANSVNAADSADAFGANAFKGAKIEIESHPTRSSTTINSVGTPAVRGGGRPASSSGINAVGTGRGVSQSRASAKIPQQAKRKGFDPKGLLVAAAALIAVSALGPSMGVNIPVISDLISDLVGGDDARIELHGNYKSVSVTLNGKAVATSVPTVIKGLPVGSPLHLAVESPAGAFQQDVTLKKGEKKVLTVVLVAASANSGGQIQGETATIGKSILLRLNVTPGGGTPAVTVNGRPVNTDSPQILVPLDAPLELIAERYGFKSFKREFVLDSKQINGLKDWLMDVPMEPLKFGFLTVHTTPSAEATIILDGKPWTRKTPIENEKFPVGTYTIQLRNELLGLEKSITVSIQEGKAISKDEHLDVIREPAH